MNDWLEWNGVRSTDKGLVILRQPDMTAPPERITDTKVPGRSGTLTVLEGKDIYDDVTLVCDGYVPDPADIPAIAAWLRGSGKLMFPARTGGHYKARVANQIPFEKVMRGRAPRACTINFRVQPFFYLDEGLIPVAVASGDVLVNPEGISSKPILQITCTGDVTVMVGQTIFQLSEIPANTNLTVDCALQEVYAGVTNMAGYMNGEFPELPAGSAPISWTGTARVTVIPHWRAFV